MGAQITQQDAVSRMTAIHGDRYDYSNVVYASVHSKITVGCKDHGDFETTFSNHTHKVSPRGCPTCGLLARAAKRTRGVDDFLAAAGAVHGDTYDYSCIDYKNNKTKVEIICSKHKAFWQTPEKHKTGQGCPECGGNRPIDLPLFLKKCADKHGSKYSYHLVDETYFTGAAVKVPVVCHEHGAFNMLYANHLFGQGCPKCARYGFNVSKPGTLYVLQDGSRVKVGITNRSIAIRLKEINKPCGNFAVAQTYFFTDGRQCADLETSLLRYMRSHYKASEGSFSGVTESFEDVDVTSVIEFIKRNSEYGKTEQEGARSVQ
jgi:hypothetical protein